MDKKFLIVLVAYVTLSSGFNFFGLFRNTEPCLGVERHMRVRGADCNQFYICDGADNGMLTKCPNTYPYFDVCNQLCSTDNETACNCEQFTTVPPPTQGPTEGPTEGPTGDPNEPPTEPPTEDPNEPPTEDPNEPPTEPPAPTSAPTSTTVGGGIPTASTATTGPSVTTTWLPPPPPTASN